MARCSFFADTFAAPRGASWPFFLASPGFSSSSALFALHPSGFVTSHEQGFLFCTPFAHPISDEVFNTLVAQFVGRKAPSFWAAAGNAESTPRNRAKLRRRCSTASLIHSARAKNSVFRMASCSSRDSGKRQRHATSAYSRSTATGIGPVPQKYCL